MRDGSVSAENAHIIVLAPGEGTSVGGSAGTPTVLKLRGDDVRGAYSLLEMQVPPGTGNRLHVHHHAEEAFYVVEGELTIRFEDREQRAPTGALILVPRGVAHSFANVGDQPTRAIFIFSPSGTERWFEEMAELRRARPDEPLYWDTIKTLALKHGTEFVE
jgi:mannose-6-phosphate isomerase-like protein (cupin superfamily)